MMKVAAFTQALNHASLYPVGYAQNCIRGIYPRITRTRHFFGFRRAFLPVPGASPSSEKLLKFRGNGLTLVTIPGCWRGYGVHTRTRNFSEFCKIFIAVPGSRPSSVQRSDLYSDTRNLRSSTLQSCVTPLSCAPVLSAVGISETGG